MPVALHAHKVDADGEIRVTHIFYGATEEDAQSGLDAHADICPKFGPADREGDVITVFEEIDELPTPESVLEDAEEEEESER